MTAPSAQRSLSRLVRHDPLGCARSPPPQGGLKALLEVMGAVGGIAAVCDTEPSTQFVALSRFVSPAIPLGQRS
jgi:hypothetical protein